MYTQTREVDFMVLLDEIAAIANNPESRFHNIATARPAVKDIFFFVYGDHSFDLPTSSLDDATFGDVGYNDSPRSDILAMEAGALIRMFVADFNPDLDRQKRVKILREILKCCTQRERAFLLHVIRNRTIPGI